MDSCSNSQTTKRSLVASLGCIALCVVLLIGTTFAWFTDTATTSVSKVQAGTLDVQLVDADGNSVEGQTLQFKKATEGSTQDVLWEPGCTYELPAVYVKNNGNLALKYKLQITGIQGNDKLNDAIEWTITDGNETASLDSDHKLAAGATSGALTIKGHMKEDAGNKYQGLSIDGVSITVVATQDTVEYDSTSNDYDKNAVYPVSSAKELESALTSAKKGDVVVLSNDIAIDTADYSVNNRLNVDADNVTIDLNGKNFTAQNCTLTLNGDNITLKNGSMVATSTSASQNHGSYVAQIYGKNVTIDGVTTTGGFNVSGTNSTDTTKPDATVTITNCNITATNFYAVCAQRNSAVTITNSTLKRGSNAFFWAEKVGYSEGGSAAANVDASIRYQTSTVTFEGATEPAESNLYNGVGVAPVAF